MNRTTRSNTLLPGNISDYLLESAQNMTNDMANTSSGGHQSQVASEDMQSLLSLIARTLSALSEQRSSSSSVSNKLEECPVRRKHCTLEAWIDEVLLWNESNSSSEPGLNGKKYLKFIDSIRKSEDSSDLQNFVQIEFAENTSFDKKQDDIIVTMITK